MKKIKRKDDSGWLKTILLLTVVIFFLLSVAFIGFAVYGVVCGKDFKVAKYAVEVGVLLSFLAIAFAIAVAAPYFISKKEVEDKIEEYLKKDYTKGLMSRTDEIERVDFHTARMIAFLLMERKYHYWAVGWGFRCIRGKDLSVRKKSIVGKDAEFLTFVFEKIMLKALENAENIPDKAEETFKGTDEPLNIKLRAIKDYLDFLYENQHSNITYVDSVNKIDRKMKETIKNLFDENNDIESVFYEQIFTASRFRKESDFKKFVYSQINTNNP